MFLENKGYAQTKFDRVKYYDCSFQEEGMDSIRLKELFDYIDFDDMVPYLNALSARQKTPSQLIYYRMAFDKLKNTKTTPNHYSIRVEMRTWEKKEYLTVLDVEGSDWERCLGSVLAIADNVTASDAEIAAQCLWGLTFYGYHLQSDNISEDASREEFLKEVIKDAGTQNKEAILSALDGQHFLADILESQLDDAQKHGEYFTMLIEKYMNSYYSDRENLLAIIVGPDVDAEYEQLYKSQIEKSIRCLSVNSPRPLYFNWRINKRHVTKLIIIAYGIKINH